MNISKALTNKKVAPYVFVFPFVAFFAVFRLWPILWSFWVSLCKYDGSNIMQFIGIKNYVDLISNHVFQQSIVNTLFFVIVYNAIMISLALVLAVLLSSSFLERRKLYRSIYFIPIAMSLPVVAIVFDLIFARNMGLIAAFYNMFGASFDVRWFSDVDLAKWGIVIMKVWRGTGYYCAFFLAGLAGISMEIYESARTDGAGPIRTFFYITIPLLRPTLMFVTIMSTLMSFQTFEEPWILTAGGPANSTLTLQIYLYQTSFLEGNIGKGSAVAYIMTMLMMAASILYVNRLGEKEK